MLQVSEVIHAIVSLQAASFTLSTVNTMLDYTPGNVTYLHACRLHQCAQTYIYIHIQIHCCWLLAACCALPPSSPSSPLPGLIGGTSTLSSHSLAPSLCSHHCHHHCDRRCPCLSAASFADSGEVEGIRAVVARDGLEKLGKAEAYLFELAKVVHGAWFMCIS